ncbi:uncharacterized protein PAC_14062 [Phialocephala subalpina]|uniref:Uncharacterized protein n=1 Tax=Phialocephala subalpina TaxID=576137 RepID=A0A1L7XGJ4_9HELO|nr:uncharacterized protein PAC_14062 [Phialocephala subalpina]
MHIPDSLSPFYAWGYNEDSKNVIKKRLIQQHPSKFLTERRFGVMRDNDEPPTVEEKLGVIDNLCSDFRQL